MMIFTHSILPCQDRQYPDTYFRKTLEQHNITYNVYLIKIGQIISQYLNQSQIYDYSRMIQKDMLWYKYPINDSGSLKRKELYHSYYDGMNDRAKESICQSKQSVNYTVDFFKFIQFGSRRTNNPDLTPVNFYKSLPINNVLNDSDFVSISRHKYKNINNEYYLPKLFTYTLSVDKSGNLSSLELRFGEICNKLQHDQMKHLMLNGNKPNILWAGEFYYIYDYKYKKYVLMVDNASGHWKPKSQLIPKYFEQLLYLALFPNYNITKLLMRESLYDYVNYYRPIVIVGHHDYPWQELKYILFPVVGEIKELYHQRAEEKRNEFWRKRIQAMKRYKGITKRLVRIKNRAIHRNNKNKKKALL